VLAVEGDRAEAVATAAVPRDRGRAFDGGRRLRASFARRPASAAATGEVSKPTVDTLMKSTV
jgi:hypothetical protein